MARNRDPRKEAPEFQEHWIVTNVVGPKWHGYKSEGSHSAEGSGNAVESGLSGGRFEGHQGSSQEGADDGAYAAFFRAAGKLDLLKFGGNPDKGTLDIYLLDGELDGAGVYSRADLLEAYGFKAPQGLQEDVTFQTSEAYAARAGDLTLHGDTLPSGLWGSDDVLIGGKPAWRSMIDVHICSQQTAGVPHGGGMVMVADPMVLINGLPAVRVGDVIVETGPPNTVVQGDSSVILGQPGPPVASIAPVESSESPGLATLGEFLDADVVVMVGRAKALGRVGGGRKEDGSIVAGAQLGGKASAIEGEVSGSVKIPLGDDWAITLGATGEGSLLTAGATAGGGVSWGAKGADGKRRWGIDEWGASAGAALVGGGAKISIGLVET